MSDDVSVKTVFIGLMLGMLLAAVNQTIVAPAMPRIVAELGGMSHYSWIAVSTLLASTVTVPIAGKLSDLYGRKRFYVGGILVFLTSAVVAGSAPTFQLFIVARLLEGVGMGTIMPLSQAIIGDLVSPRERGKYQGYMGGVFGFASIIGPFLGGWITDNMTWHWLFFINVPVGLVALAFIIPFMRLRHVRRAHTIDYAGFFTLTIGLTTVLLATVWGGVEYPWNSLVIKGLYAIGVCALALFVWVESRAAEPVLPLGLWRNRVFTASNLSTMFVAMGMFGAIYFIPVFVQGVQGGSVTHSGAVLIPMMLSLVVMSAINGQIITRTGHYKPSILLGIIAIGIGFILLTGFNRATTSTEVVRTMILIGLGLGACMQTFVLVVQNAASREEMGVATATTQLFRSIGSSVGIAVLGTIMTSGLQRALPQHLPASALRALTSATAGEGAAGAALDPHLIARLPPEVVDGVRNALDAALHPVFVAALPFVALAFLAALFIPVLPLRRTVPASAVESGRELLAELSQSDAGDEPALGVPNPVYTERLQLLGSTFLRLSQQAGNGASPGLHELVSLIGDGDAEQGRTRLQRLGNALLMRYDDVAGDEGLRFPAPLAELERVRRAYPTDLRVRLRRLIRERRHPREVLTAEDLESLERVALILSSTQLGDSTSTSASTSNQESENSKFESKSK